MADLATQTQTPTPPQTFKLGDGSEYDISGNEVKPAGSTPNFSVTPPASFSPSTVNQAFDPSAPTVPDIRNTIATKQTSIDSSLQKVLDYFTPTSEETAAAADVAKLKGEAAQLQQDTQNKIAAQEVQPVTAAVVTAQQNETSRQGQYKLNSKNIQLQTALDVLQNLQTSRTAKLDAAKFVYDAKKNDLTDTINIYKTLAPENIGTQVDAATGNVYVLTKNPLTGQVVTQVAGNIGPSKAYQSSEIKIDENTGDTVFYGVKPDGSIETRILTKGTGPTNLNYETREVGGRIIRFGFNKQGQVVSRVDLGSSGGGTSTEKLTPSINLADNYFQKGIPSKGLPGRGQDGYASPETYNAIRDAWIADGHSATTFDETFSKYVNPSHPQDYQGSKVTNAKPQFLTADYFKGLFGNDALEQSAKAAGFTKKTGLFSKSGDVDAYLNDLMSKVQLYRASGKSDDEILKMFPTKKK